MARKSRIHNRPRAPVTMKAGRHPPQVRYTQYARKGATAPPIAEPLSNSATARPLSVRGNHSATALVAPGQLADSPAPNRKRKPHRLRKPAAVDVSIAERE